MIFSAARIFAGSARITTALTWAFSTTSRIFNMLLTVETIAASVSGLLGFVRWMVFRTWSSWSLRFLAVSGITTMVLGVIGFQKVLV